MLRQTNTPKATLELDTMVGMNILMSQKGCARSEHFRHTDSTLKNGA